MLVPLLVAALLQTSPPAPQAAAPTSPRAADTAATDSSAPRRRGRKPAKRVALTAEHVATAFRDSAARALLHLARAARLDQDSALRAYDATTYQRVSAGVGFAHIGRARLAFRSESATHVRWQRGVGAYVEVTGARAVVPIAGSSGHVVSDGDISPIPYYPGSETLWIGQSAARGAVDENDGIVHPLAEGAEAYYTYASGDSVSFRLPDGRTIRLRELKVRPREPRWNLAVGSLWFDVGAGHLVRAAYRMSVPMDIVAVAKADDPHAFDDVPLAMRPLLNPMTAQVSAMGVEYGLFQGRFWLPRVQVLEGGANVGFMRMPLKLEQRFEYAAVNGDGPPLPPIAVSAADSARRALQISIGGRGDSLSKPQRALRDSLRRERRTARARCDSSGNRVYTRQSDDMPNPIHVVMSCDSTRLAHSPDLPLSIYDKGDDAFGGAEMDALVAQALSMGAQAQWSPQLPTVALDRPRYNRVEGLSVGGRADQTLGAGYSLHALARIGVADREPNAELTGARSDLRRTLSLTGYNRLVAANDWGNPLSFGSSISALLFGRDEGFYYRASGLELASTPDDAVGGGFSWGVFAEQERSARQRTTFSLVHAVHSASEFQPNVEANRGTFIGARTRLTHSLGLDPQGFRLFSDVRLEGAHGDSGAYGRGALELTASHGIGNGAAALTVASGSTLGTVPAQRYWFLGGTQTVRGQAPGLTAGKTGNAFWLARGETAYGVGVLRPVVFADLGWAGDRTRWRDIGRPLSGVGVGTSLMDGLVRLDVARGINPDRQWRVDAYVEGRF